MTSKFDQLLIKPHLDHLPDHTLRNRRNMYLTAVIAFMYVFASGGVDVSKSSFFGLKFESFDATYLSYLFLTLISYFYIHYAWEVSDHQKENRLRLTGVYPPRPTHGKGGATSLTPYAGTTIEKQSSLMSWWSLQRGHLGYFLEILQGNSRNNAVPDNLELVNTLKKAVEETINNVDFTSEAIARFERGFWFYQRSQSIRFLVFNWIIPTIVALGMFGAICEDIVTCNGTI